MCQMCHLDDIYLQVITAFFIVLMFFFLLFTFLLCLLLLKPQFLTILVKTCSIQLAVVKNRFLFIWIVLKC